MEYIDFDGVQYWSIDEDYPKWKFVNDVRLEAGLKEVLLESDSYQRIDLQHLRMKEFDAAEKEKYDVEENQRKDARNREAAEIKRSKQQTVLKQ